MSFFISLFSQRTPSPIDLSAESNGYTANADQLHSDVCGCCSYICFKHSMSLKPCRHRFPISQKTETHQQGTRVSGHSTQIPVVSKPKVEPLAAKMCVISPFNKAHLLISKFLVKETRMLPNLKIYWNFLKFCEALIFLRYHLNQLGCCIEHLYQEPCPLGSSISCKRRYLASSVNTCLKIRKTFWSRF